MKNMLLIVSFFYLPVFGAYSHGGAAAAQAASDLQITLDALKEEVAELKETFDKIVESLEEDHCFDNEPSQELKKLWIRLCKVKESLRDKVELDEEIAKIRIHRLSLADDLPSEQYNLFIGQLTKVENSLRDEELRFNKEKWETPIKKKRIARGASSFDSAHRRFRGYTPPMDYTEEMLPSKGEMLPPKLVLSDRKRQVTFVVVEEDDDK